MPFTPSHAVVALPFVRTPLVPAAIAIGAMTPDLPLFVRVAVPSYATTHDPAAVGLTAVLALALLVLWRCVLRPAVRELAPAPLARRLPEDWDRGAVAGLRETFGVERGRVRMLPIVLLALSLAIGVLSHIAWDAFTHEGRLGVALIPALSDRWGPLLGVKWLQHLSSVAGLVILAVWAATRLHRARSAALVRRLPSVVRICWWLSLPVVLVTAWGIGLLAYGPLDASFTVAHLAYRVLPPACALWGAATVALALAVPLARRTREGRKHTRHARDASGFVDPRDPT